jgi:outer membrane protein assembly factor BamB
MRTYRHYIAWIAIVAGLATSAIAGDWPIWGGTPARNMVSSERSLPTTWNAGTAKDDGTIDRATVSPNVKWIAKLGTQSYGNATVSNGQVFVGTNNAGPHFQEDQSGDFSVLLCLDEATGKPKWSDYTPKLAAGKASDWEQVGLCCSPTVDGDRVYIVNNRCEVVCLDAHATGKAKAIWRFDMRDEVGAFSHNMTSSSPLVVGDKLYVTTSNGVDWTEHHIPAPDAPALICLDKSTGKLLGIEKSGICRRMFISNWSSPAYGVIAGKPTIVFGGGDGFCYGFDAEPKDGVLNERWRCDCNPPERRNKNGVALKHSQPEGPREIISTPVIIGDRIYVAIGHEPEGGDGLGAAVCIDATKSGDITSTGKIWSNNDVGRTVSTVSVADGLVYLAEFAGVVHCMNAADGHELWHHDTEGHIWGSTLLADGKIYVGNESGAVFIFQPGKEDKLLEQIDMKEAIYSTPVAANGVLYISTTSNLYAIGGK